MINSRFEGMHPYVGLRDKEDARKQSLLELHTRRKQVKAWLEENKAKIEVFYLPSYSPQLNPDERLNADLKYALGSTVAMRSKSALWHAAVEYMTMLEHSPERVMSYFKDPRVRYAV